MKPYGGSTGRAENSSGLSHVGRGVEGAPDRGGGGEAGGDATVSKAGRL